MSAAPAQERITPGFLGAVRPARGDTHRSANPECRSDPTALAREQRAERSTRAQWRPLQRNGGTFSKAGDREPYVVSDGLLVTGQNPASSGPAAARLTDG